MNSMPAFTPAILITYVAEWLNTPMELAKCRRISKMFNILIKNELAIYPHVNHYAGFYIHGDHVYINEINMWVKGHVCKYRLQVTDDHLIDVYAVRVTNVNSGMSNFVYYTIPDYYVTKGTLCHKTTHVRYQFNSDILKMLRVGRVKIVAPKGGLMTIKVSIGGIQKMLLEYTKKMVYYLSNCNRARILNSIKCFQIALYRSSIMNHNVSTYKRDEFVSKIIIAHDIVIPEPILDDLRSRLCDWGINCNVHNESTITIDITDRKVSIAYAECICDQLYVNSCCGLVHKKTTIDHNHGIICFEPRKTDYCDFIKHQVFDWRCQDMQHIENYIRKNRAGDYCFDELYYNNRLFVDELKDDEEYVYKKHSYTGKHYRDWEVLFEFHETFEKKRKPIMTNSLTELLFE